MTLDRILYNLYDYKKEITLNNKPDTIKAEEFEEYIRKIEEEQINIFTNSNGKRFKRTNNQNN